MHSTIPTCVVSNLRIQAKRQEPYIRLRTPRCCWCHVWTAITEALCSRARPVATRFRCVGDSARCALMTGRRSTSVSPTLNPDCVRCRCSFTLKELSFVAIRLPNSAIERLRSVPSFRNVTIPSSGKVQRKYSSMHCKIECTIMV